MSRANLLPWREKDPAWLHRFRHRPTERALEDHAYLMGQCDGRRGEWGRCLDAGAGEGARWAYYWGYVAAGGVTQR